MAIMVPTAGETIILNRIFNASLNELQVGLFTSSVVPTKSTTLIDLVRMTSAIDSSYVDKDLTAPATVINGVATFNSITWTLDGGVSSYDIWGYFVIDKITGELIWCEKFPSKFIISTTGGTVKVTLKMELD
jgi:hypothetical protein